MLKRPLRPRPNSMRKTTIADSCLHVEKYYRGAMARGFTMRSLMFVLIASLVFRSAQSTVAAQKEERPPERAPEGRGH